MEIVISPQGTAHCVYVEAIDLHTLGDLHIRRASHVEPDEQGRWWADLAPVQGPNLGPFIRRSDALDSEAGWLRANLLALAPVKVIAHEPRPRVVRFI